MTMPTQSEPTDALIFSLANRRPLTQSSDNFGCISKDLIDVGLDIKFADEEWIIVKELLLSLQRLKLGVKVLWRRNSTLNREE